MPWEKTDWESKTKKGLTSSRRIAFRVIGVKGKTRLGAQNQMKRMPCPGKSGRCIKRGIVNTRIGGTPMLDSAVSIRYF